MNFQSKQNHRPVAERTDQNVFFYFFRLDRDHECIEDFSAYWAEVGKRVFSAKGLSNIIHKVAKNLSDYDQTLDRYAGVIECLEDKISIWEDKAIAKMDEFTPQNLSNSLWALATLGISPSNKFMDAWESHVQEILNTTPEAFNEQDYSNSLWALAVIDSLKPSPNNQRRYDLIRSKAHLDTFNFKNRKQIYDSDLWFTDSSTIKNPDFEHKKEGSSEKPLRDLFNQAGFQAELVEKPVITSLPQALDIKVTDPKQGKLFMLNLTAMVTSSTQKKQVNYYGIMARHYSGAV